MLAFRSFFALRQYFPWRNAPAYRVPILLGNHRQTDEIRMHLLLITNIFPNPYQPNLGIFNWHVARALAREHEVQVISPISWVEDCRGKWSGSGQMPPGRSELREGIPIWHPRFYYPPKVFRTRYGTFLWKSIESTVRKVLQTFRPDAVVGYWEHPDGEVAVRVARMIGVPAIVMSGGSGVLVLSRNPKRRRCLINVFEQADAVIAVGQDLKSKILELGMQAEKVHIVPRGVDLDQFAPGDRQQARRKLGIPETGRHLLWVGRMVPIKGLDVLLTACAQLRQAGQEFRLFLVGDGPLKRRLETECKSRGLADAVSFVGPVLHQHLPDWYRAADLTLLPSLSEGIPNVLRESLACGTPFVASRVGGIPEIADASASSLVEPNNPAALADGILHHLNNGHGNGIAKARPVTWAQSAQFLMNVIEPLVERNRQQGPYWNVNEFQKSAKPLEKVRPRWWRQMIKRLLSVTLPRQWLLTRGPGKSATVCLTFDDGPDAEHTPALLDVLQQHQIRATFFVIGEKAEQYPDLVRRMAAEGHLVGNHSYCHSHWANTPAWRLADELHQTRELLGRLLGSAAPFFRPPGGKLTFGKLVRLWRARQTVVLWNKDPKDYACRSSQELSHWFQAHPLQDGDLVLLHDRLPFAREVLPELIHQARRDNLEFVTVADWMPNHRTSSHHIVIQTN